ncbi:PASTA domain-containing protein [Cnuibacter sp. UC19_7]|uniref:PASTA domain-containing protein n=1 Tax=Cnuibacter sp. UC19_7 TaxID=3350166 RepID=UPI00366FFA1E
MTDAQTLLVAAGLSVGSVSGSPSSAARDTVLAVSPDTGSPAPLGRPIDLVVATGENVVPIVEGTGAAEAADAVRAAGFAVRLTGDAAGAVTLSNPIAGTLLPLGQTVTLVLASAPQPAGPSSPPPTSPPPSTTTPRPTSAGAQR